MDGGSYGNLSYFSTVAALWLKVSDALTDKLKRRQGKMPRGIHVK
jgi:hypothetical protein